MRTIYQTASLEEAEFVRMALRDHDIDSFLEDEGAAMLVIGLPSTAALFRIAVADEHEQAAMKVVTEVLEARKRASRGDPGAQKP